MTLFAGFGHMHMLGRAMKVELNPGTPNAKVVLDVPQFDFDNQRLMKLPSPVEIGPGDTLRVTCTHDAGLRKQLPQLKQAAAALRGVGRRHQRRDVHWHHDGLPPQVLTKRRTCVSSPRSTSRETALSSHTSALNGR